MPKLVVIAKGKPREIEMGQELTIGRGYSNLLRLEGDEISRVHAIIYRRNDDFILRDLDSKNGVFLNGTKVNHAPLGPGDKVQVGKYRMVFNPPKNFDMDSFADSAGRQESSASARISYSARDAAQSDDELATSRRFKVAVAGHGSSDMLMRARGSESREEVHIYSRGEFRRLLNEVSGRRAEAAADYQDLFFHAILDTQAPGTNYLVSVLTALCKSLSVDRGVIILRDANGQLRPGAIVAVEADVAVNRIVLKSGFSEEKTMLCPRTDESGLFRDNDTVRRDRISSLISIPIGRHETTGLLYLDRIGDTEPLNEVHLITAGRIARLVEMHLETLGAGKPEKVES